MAKEEVKLSLFADNMILYARNPLKKILLELIHEFSKVSGYKNKIQKSIVFLYNSNEQSKNKIKQIILSIIASRRMLRNKFNQRYARDAH